MDDPTELANAAANANGRCGETIYEVLNHDRIQDGEYMTIGTTFQGDTNHTKSKKLEETFAEQATSLSILKWICVVLGITVVIISVTFGVLIHELVSSYQRI